MPPAITVDKLSKAYRIGLKEQRQETLVGTLTNVLRAPLRNLRRLSRLNTFKNQDEAEDTFWALRDVSFEVAEGEVVGIIGRNGAGKSTLLKILSRITEPTSGRAVIRGRVSSLLEVGTGFHPELTGRENVYMNGTILGMTKKEIDWKFDEIVSFSGVEKFLDTSIKHYSSGMKVRLAFAVAAHLEPEILIIDEVLAVGDAEFQNKCLGKMQDVARGGRTVLFVSHNMAAVQNLCSRGIVLGSGRITDYGQIDVCIAAYLSSFASTAGNTDVSELPRERHLSPVIRRIRLINDNGQSVCAIPTCSALNVEIDYEHRDPLVEPLFGIHIESITGINVAAVESNYQPGVIRSLPRKGTVTCRLASLPLVPGTYSLTFRCASSRKNIDFIARGLNLEVTPADVLGAGKLPAPTKAIVLLEASWILDHRVNGSLALT